MSSEIPSKDIKNTGFYFTFAINRQHSRLESLCCLFRACQTIRKFVANACIVVQKCVGIITGFSPQQQSTQCFWSSRLPLVKLIKQTKNIKQFGGHKKINIYATKNLHKYKSESGVGVEWSSVVDRGKINFLFVQWVEKLKRLFAAPPHHSQHFSAGK